MEPETGVSGREQRKKWRHACNGNALLYDLITQRRMPGMILDLSISGCLIRPDQPGFLRAGDVMEVSFALHGVSIRATGCIRNIRPDHAMGIEFRRLTESTTAQIVRLLNILIEESESHPQPETRE